MWAVNVEVHTQPRVTSQRTVLNDPSPFAASSLRSVPFAPTKAPPLVHLRFEAGLNLPEFMFERECCRDAFSRVWIP